MNRFKLASLSASVCVLFMVGCGEKQIAERIPDTWAKPKQECPNGTDRSALAGEWRYLQDGSSFFLNLDGQGNGNYSWKDGRFISLCLDRSILRGVWIQKDNDREGGFEVTLNSDMTNGEGHWWYSRIGKETKPNRDGRGFRLERVNNNNAGLPQTMKNIYAD
jgi:hypothetical protein